RVSQAKAVRGPSSPRGAESLRLASIERSNQKGVAWRPLFRLQLLQHFPELMTLALEELCRAHQRRYVGETLQHRLERHPQVELEIGAKQARRDDLTAGMHDVAACPIDALDLPPDATLVGLDQVCDAGGRLDPLDEG